MSCILQKRMWLAGASLLAIVLGSGDANAVVFGGPGGAEYIIPSTGWYDFSVAGAEAGQPFAIVLHEPGARVGGELFLAAGATLDLVVGGAGGNGFGGNGYGGGGGGGSFVFGGGLLFAAAGGGFGPGLGYGGHPAGPASYGGAGGFGVAVGFPPGSAHGQTPAQAGSSPTAAQGRVAISGEDHRAATVAAVVVAIMATEAAVVLPVFAATAAAIHM
jgi:hypothetical protein